MKNLFTLILLVLAVFILNAQISTNEIPISFEKEIRFKRTKTLNRFSKLDLKQILIEDSLRDGSYSELPERFSVPIEVNLTTNNSGDWSTIDEFNVWQLQINAPDAKAITLVYDKFWLPEGAKLFIYSYDKKHLLGAFTSMNNNKVKEISGFVTGFVKGDDIIVEYYEPKNIKEKGIISISRIGYVYKDLAIFNYETLSGFGNSLSCHVNINCPDGNNWQNEKRAVAAIYNIYGGAICSGALVNNTSNNRTPYLLTANHCLSGSDAEGNNNLWHWVFYWNYESPNCSNGNDFTPPSSQGAMLKANNSYTDFALLELNDNLDNVTGYTPYYLGWTRSTTAATSATGIHHPRGDIKKISVDNNPISIHGNTINWVGGTTSQPNTHWKTIFDIGAIQGGSSGSPLFDQNHRVIGQLHGGDVTCSPLTSYYGRFDLSWDYGSSSTRRLKDWLDPIGSNPQTIDGKNSLTISGSSSICAQSTYTIEDLPTGAIVTWQVGSGLIIQSGQNTSTVTVSAAGNAVASWVKAQVTIGSTTVSLQQKDVWVGTPSIYVTGQQHLPNGGYYSYQVVDQNLDNTTTYQWSISPSIPFTVTTDGKYMSAHFPPYTDADYTITVTATNSCGSYSTNYHVATGEYEPYIVFPNPPTDFLSITKNNAKYKKGESNREVTVELYDNLGNLKRKEKSLDKDLKISVRGLLSGVYMLKIKYGDTVENHQIIIR